MSIATEVETLVLGLGQNGISMTPDEFDAVTEYDDLYRYELIHGVLIVNPIPSAEERGPNETLGRFLLNYQEDNPKGMALDGTLTEEYVCSLDSRRRADRVIWAGLGRQPDPSTDIPTIAVEFVSAGRRSWKRDYLEKRDEYLSLGVAEYWVIDRFQRTLTVYRKTAAGIEQQQFREQELYQSKLLPGFDVPLAKILAVADRWGKQ